VCLYNYSLRVAPRCSNSIEEKVLGNILPVLDNGSKTAYSYEAIPPSNPVSDMTLAGFFLFVCFRNLM